MEENKTFYIVEKKELDELINEVRELKRELKSTLGERLKEEAKSIWIESEEARKMLGVSQRTWQAIRDRRDIPFSQYGRKIYVKVEDIDEFIESHKVN